MEPEDGITRGTSAPWRGFTTPWEDTTCHLAGPVDSAQPLDEPRPSGSDVVVQQLLSLERRVDLKRESPLHRFLTVIPQDPVQFRV